MTWQPRPELAHLYPDVLRERAEADDLTVHPPAPADDDLTPADEARLDRAHWTTKYDR